ncbi:MAG: alpha/beta hydrolase [Betaproteobacteria bacterium]|nr:alpha/beta hydrolase [Betaproteobacteria bacterium]
MRWRFAAAVALAAAMSDAIGAEPASHWFTTSDQVRLHVLEAGLRDGDSPVVAFVPGWSMPASIFRPQLAALGERYAVAALDPRGQGLSDVPAGGYAIGRRAQDIAEFVARYRRVVLVAWSLGALEALEYVHEHGADALHALVLVDSSVGEDPPPPSGSDFVAELERDRPAALQGFVRGMFRSPRPEAELRALRDQAMRMPLSASISLFPSSVPRKHWRQIARAVPVPLVYAVTPPLAAQAENLRRARPATRIAVFADAGHALFVDDPERFNRLLESLLADSAGR